MKLYLVSIKTCGRYGKSYVVADNPDQAYKKIRSFLDKNDLCFSDERRLESVVLLADTNHYGSDAETMLFLCDSKQDK